MFFETSIHYAGCRSCLIHAETAEDAGRLARERFHASSPGGPRDIEEITFLGVAPIDNDGAQLDTAEGMDAASGYDLARARTLLLSYVTAINAGAYADVAQLIADVTRDLRRWPGGLAELSTPREPPPGPPLQLEVTLDEYVRIHLGLTLGARAHASDPVYLALRNRLDEVAAQIVRTTRPAGTW